MRHLTLMVLGVSVGAPALAVAQEPDRDREREQQLEHAMQQVETAQRELEAALDRMRASEEEAANEALREAMAALRAAERQLRSGYYRDLYSGLARARVMVGPERVWTAPDVDASVLLSVGRPQMGVILETSRRGEADGAVIRAVTPGGPADEAGIEAGDVIVEANGTDLSSSGRRDDTPSEKLVGVIQELEEGETLSVRYRRGDETHTAEMEVRHLEPLSYAYSFRTDSADNNMLIYESPRAGVRVPDPTMTLDFAEPVFGALMPFGWLSMEMVTLDEELGEYFGTSEGLLVIRPPKDDSIDLKSGDVILGIDGRTPSSPSHALRIMRSYDPGESMTIQVMRNKRNVEVTVTVPERDRGFFWENRWEHDEQEDRAHEDDKDRL
jgi:hypothetical protein